MADKREAVPVLKDQVDGSGKHLAKVLEGDLASGKNALPALVAKKRSDGTLSYIAVNDLGQVIVENSPDIEARLWDSGKVTDSALNVASTVVTIPLLTSKVYRGLSAVITSAMFSRADLVWNDNGTLNNVVSIDVNGGYPTQAFELSQFEFTSGASGTQELKLIVTVLDGVATDVHGHIGTTEIQDT